MADSFDLENMKLSDLFDLGWKEQRELNKTTLCEQSSEYLLKRKKAVDLLKKCEFMLDEIHLFSDNESIDETSTSELRYFINYALLGWLFNKVNSREASVRLAALFSAKNYFIKYLNLTRNYEIHKLNVEKLVPNEKDPQAALEKVVLDTNRQASFDAGLTAMAYDRNEKIKRFKEQKELEKQIDAMSNVLDANKSQQVDDEVRRKFYMNTIRYWINVAIDELKCINEEIMILKSVETRSNDNPEQTNRMYASIGGASGQSASDGAAKKPFIITRDALQAKVFGLGYPSVPVYSIDEFYDQKVADGCMPQVVKDPSKSGAHIGGGVTDSQKEDDKATKDALADAHDEEEVKRMRGWDDFTDDNKRGSGNTYNRS